ncbi:ERF family protein [Stutzerimonas sp. NM35]
MNKSEQINELATALAKAQGELENASKSSSNPHFKSKYADLAEILNTVRPVFANHGLHVHADHDWLAASPDGLVGHDGLIEVKCPFRATYTSIAEVPHYAAQIQLQLACTMRDWCDFVIWRDGEIIVERVDADPASAADCRSTAVVVWPNFLRSASARPTCVLSTAITSRAVSVISDLQKRRSPHNGGLSVGNKKPPEGGYVVATSVSRSSA